jgi:hypothetical protein
LAALSAAGIIVTSSSMAARNDAGQQYSPTADMSYLHEIL